MNYFKSNTTANQNSYSTENSNPQMNYSTNQAGSRDTHRVLIVDDEEDVCFIINSMLKSKGFETEVGHTVRECREKIEKFHPTHVILDINLPDGNGLKVLEEIKSVHEDINVIMHSALDTKENRSIADEKGAIGFLTKPINRSQLMDYLNS